MSQIPHHERYIITLAGGWWYVEDVFTGNRSRRFLSEVEARTAQHGIVIRDLINE